MALNILCDGSHKHAPWSIQNGVFDTAREAEYTPALAKALATTILESLAGEYKLTNVSQVAKKLKLSHFQAIAAGKQPTKSLAFPTVPEFAYILVLANLPQTVNFSLLRDVTLTCTTLDVAGTHFLVPCGCKLLRRTTKRGENRPFKYTVEHTPSLSSMGDIGCNMDEFATKRATPVLSCIGHGGDGKIRCEGTAAITFVSMPTESFLQQAVSVGHPFKNFSGLSDDVRAACEFAASAAHEQVVELRCKKLGSWLQKVRALESEEKLLKEKNASGKASHTGVQAYCFYETCYPGGGL